MARNLLWASLALAPVVFLLNWVVGAGDVVLFVARRVRAHSARLADRRGDRARRRAHRAGNRRVPQRDLRQRAGADHRAARHQPGAAERRARLAGWKRRVEHLARARRCARRSGATRASTGARSPCSSGSSLFATAGVPRPVDSGLPRRPGAALARDRQHPRLDRPARRLRRVDPRQPAAAPPRAPGEPRPSARRGLEPGCVARRARGRDGRHGLRQRDPRAHARPASPTRRTCPSSSSRP